MPNLKIGYLPQEPQLDPTMTVRQAVESGLGEAFDARAKLDAVYAAYAEPDADFDALATEQARLEAIISSADGGNLELQLEVAADGRIVDYKLRQPNQKQKAVAAFQSLNYRVLAAGDSFNDTTMLGQANAGFFFHAPKSIQDQFPQFPAYDRYEDLLAAMKAAL
jgi:hypothetical protein